MTRSIEAKLNMKMRFFCYFSPALQSTMWNVGKSIVQHDSVRGLWKGFAPVSTIKLCE